MLKTPLIGVALPAVLAAAILVIAWPPRRGAGRARGGRWATPFALGVALLVSFLSQAGWPDPPWSPTWERWWSIAPLILLAAVAGVVTALLAERSAWAAMAVIAVALVTAWGVVPAPLDPLTWWRTGVGGTVMVLAATVEPLADRRRGAVLPLAFAIVFATVAAVLLQTYFAKLAMVAAAGAAALVAAAVIGGLNRAYTLAGGGVLLVAAVLPSLMVLAYYYDTRPIPPAGYVLPLAAAPLLWLAEAPVVEGLPAWARFALRVSIVLIPCAIAVALTL